jgi:glycosyltransferase involved in cell wall biosynthesis
MVHQFLPRKKFLPAHIMREVKIVTVSQALREYLVNTVRLDKEQIAVLRNGIDTAAYPTHEHASGPSTLIVGMCDRYMPERGHDCFLKACSLLLDRGKAAHFFVCGYGEGEEQVKETARRLGIYKDVTFVYEFKDIRKIMSLYDIFVIPSKKEGLGYRALEAMAMGIPVIASSTGGLMDIVHDEETGLLFKPGDPEKMADKIEYLLDHPDEIREMGKKGAEMIQASFSADRMVDDMLAIYTSYE